MFRDELDELARMEEALLEERLRFAEARQTAEEAREVEPAIGAELDGLPVMLAQAQLADDEEAQEAIRERHRVLLGRLAGARARREAAEEAFGGADPWQAESLCYQRASNRADRIVRDAAALRRELAAAVHEAAAELQIRAGRISAYRRAHNVLKEQMDNG